MSNCDGPGATHHAACDCREREWAERLAGADRALFAERERVVRAELRASSLSRELLDAMQARDRLAERAVTMQLMLDTIEGWATGQPGKMPTAVEDGWSTALSAAVARLAAAESRAARLLTALRDAAEWCEATGDFNREVKARLYEIASRLRAALAAEEGK